jgi:hypothetical protein
MLSRREAACRVSEKPRTQNDRANRGSEWALQDSNLGRAGYEPAALTAELRALRDF